MLKLVEIQIVVTTLTDRFFFFLQFTVMCWDKTKIFMVWSEPPEWIRYIAIYILSFRVHSIYCDIFFSAERFRYMTCRLTSDISTKEFHHYSALFKLFKVQLCCWDCSLLTIPSWRSNLDPRAVSRGSISLSLSTSRMLCALESRVAATSSRSKKPQSYTWWVWRQEQLTLTKLPVL